MTTNDRFLVTDETNDRKYFTIVPNYVFDNLTMYEREVYLLMKRIAGDGGTCWISALHIAKKLKINRRTVVAARESLVKNKLIELVGKRGKTKPTDEYKIVDIWKRNVLFYNKK